MAISFSVAEMAEVEAAVEAHVPKTSDPLLLENT
jgi:hypothetical protein